MDVTLLWFKCKNPSCDYIPLKSKKDKIERAWKHGESIQNSKRPRYFMRYVEGYYLYKNNGDLIFYVCKHGTICMYDANESQICNDYFNPLENMELCQPCIDKLHNEKVLFNDR